MTTRVRATLADLARNPGKAELIDGEIVPMAPTGDAPGDGGRRGLLLPAPARREDRHRPCRQRRQSVHRQPSPSSISQSQRRLLHRAANGDGVLFPGAGLRRRSAEQRRLRPPRRRGDRPPSARITSLPARSSCGTWTCWPKRSFRSIRPRTPLARPSSAEVRRPTPSRPCPSGAWRSMTFSGSRIYAAAKGVEGAASGCIYNVDSR